MLQNDLATTWPARRDGADTGLDQASASVPEGDPGYQDLLQDHPRVRRGGDEWDVARSGYPPRDPLRGRGAGRVIPL